MFRQCWTRKEEGEEEGGTRKKGRGGRKDGEEAGRRDERSEKIIKDASLASLGLVVRCVLGGTCVHHLDLV